MKVFIFKLNSWYARYLPFSPFSQERLKNFQKHNLFSYNTNQFDKHEAVLFGKKCGRIAWIGTNWVGGA